MKKITTLVNIVINGVIVALLDSTKIDKPALAKKFGVTEAQVRDYPEDFTQEMIDDGGQLFAGRVRVVSNRGCSMGDNPVASLQVQLFPVEGQPPSFIEVVMWKKNPRAKDPVKQATSFDLFRSLKPGQYIFLTGTRKNSPRTRVIKDEYGNDSTVSYRNVRITARSLMIVDGWIREDTPAQAPEGTADESHDTSGTESHTEDQSASTEATTNRPRRGTKSKSLVSA